MASGNLSLAISEDTGWETFPDQAADFVRRFGGIVLKRIDTPVERMWIVLVKCTSVIHDIHAKLLAEAQS